jgi:hypothetical protein
MKVLDSDHSPLQRATEEVLTEQRDNPTPKKKSPGRRVAGTTDWAPVFIGAIMEGAHVRRAARIAGVDPSVPYTRRKTDEAFRQAWKEASDVGTEILEQEAARRAYHGTLKPVFHKGVTCGAIREYNDTLLIFLLKARNPAKYREGVDAGKGGSFVLNVNIVEVENDTPALPAVEQLPAVAIKTVVQSNT